MSWHCSRNRVRLRSVQVAREKKQRWPAVVLFFLLFFSYAYVNGGWGFNQYSRLDVLHSLVYHHTITIDAHHSNTGDKSVFNGHYYSDKAPGIFALALPAYLFSAGLLTVAGVDPESGKAWNISHWITSAGSVGLITALGGVAFFLFLLRFLKPKIALITVLATFLGSLPFTYAILLFSHAAVIGLLCIALWCIFRNPVKGKGRVLWLRWDFLAGLCVGLALASEYTAGIAFLGMFILMLRFGWKRTLTFSVGALLALLLIPLNNWLCFHSLFAIGYTHVEGWGGMQKGFFGVTFPPSPEAAYGLLFSMSRGLFFWTPFFLLAFIGLYPLLKKNQWLGMIAFCVCLLQIIAIAGYSYWDGGVALGPRHLAAMIPFIALLAGFGLQTLPKTGSLLAAVSILLTGTASAISPGIHHVANPIMESYYPRIVRSDFIQNWTSAFGLRGIITLLPLALGILWCSLLLLHALRNRKSPSKYDRVLTTLRTSCTAPIAVFLCSTLIVALAASRVGADGSSAKAYAHWDSGHYLSIAQGGYEFMSCSKVPGYNPKDWCGNAGWFPGYPILIHAFTDIGLLGEGAGVTISLFCFFCILLLLWNVFLKGMEVRSRWAVLLLASVFPGSIYYHAVFPISTVLLCMLLTYWLSAKRNWVAAGLAGFLGAFSYPTGILSAPLSLLFLMPRQKNKKYSWRTLFGPLIVCGFTILGLLAVLLLHYKTTGVWDAFFRVQSKYGFGHHNPLSTAIGLLKPVMQLQFWQAPPQSLQSLFTILLLLLALGTIVRQRKTASAIDLVLLSHGMLFWLFPMILGGGLSIYRAEGLLLPIVVLLRRLPAWFLLILVIIGVLLKFQLSMLFFRGALI